MSFSNGLGELGLGELGLGEMGGHQALIYRVVQKNEATLHFPKYLENYWR